MIRAGSGGDGNTGISTSLNCGSGAAQAANKASNKPAKVSEGIRAIVGIRKASAAVNLTQREQEMCQIVAEEHSVGYGIKVALDIMQLSSSPFHI